MARRFVFFLLLCLGLTISVAAQSGPLCGVGVTPTSGPAPLTVTATGGCTDATGAITSETLDWGDGTQTPIPPPSFAAFTLTHPYTSAGTFNIVLSAVDSNGAGGSSPPQTVTVIDTTPSCTLTVTPSSGTAPLNVTASGNCTDAGNDITSTVITWGDGASTNGTSGTHTYTGTGTFTVTLTATDAAGKNGTATQSVTVNGNQPPHFTLSLNPASGNVPLTVNATGNCTDPENDITSTIIDWGDGTKTSGTSGSHTYTVAGHYNVTLTATDSCGLTGSASQKVDAHKSVNQPPTCALSVAPNAGPAPLTVNASGNCTDPENDIVSTILDWGDSTPPLNNTSGTHTYKVVATYTVKLTATDSAGNVGIATQTVTVGSGHNAPPTCSMTASPGTGQVPFSVTVAPHCTDLENDITLITIDFGDSFYTTVGPGANASHTYTRSGAFTAVVKATDIAGNVSNAASQTITASDVASEFVGVGSGQIKQFDQNGKTLKSLATNQGGSLTGMAFDWLDALYVTDFSADTVSKFNGNGTLIGTFGSGYNCKPESIVFDNSGNAYVGETGCSHALLKFDAYGNLAAAYTVSTEVEGSDWIDLAADQCTIYYTSQGTTVFRFNACTGQQQPPFATGLTTGLAVKILGDGSVLVADKADIVHFDSCGHVIGKFTAPDESCLVSLALDPDGKTFWALDYCSSDVLRFDVGSGAQVTKFSSGAAAQTTYGIGMPRPAPTITPAGPLIASSESVTISAGQSASFNVAFVPSGSAVGQSFNFSCANLPVGATCNFTPQSATVTSAGITVPVTITTKAASHAQMQGLFAQKFMAFWTLFAGVLFAGDLGFRRRSRTRMWRLMLVILLLAGLIACSASSKSSGGNSGGNTSAPTATSTTPAGTYTVVVRATANNGLQSSTVVSLAVQ